MQRVGDDLAGFSVDTPSPDSLTVKAWGFWNVNVAAAFAPAVLEACRGRAQGGALTLDMSDIKPMRDEAQQAFVRVVQALPTVGVTKLAVVTTNPLAKLQLVRLVTESRTRASVEWIAGTNPQGRNA